MIYARYSAEKEDKPNKLVVFPDTVPFSQRGTVRDSRLISHKQATSKIGFLKTEDVAEFRGEREKLYGDLAAPKKTASPATGVDI